MNNEVRISVSVFLPWAKNELRYNYAVSRLEAEENMTPLPRDRELPFAYWSHEEARAKRERRNRLARVLGAMISNAILDACERQDTVSGYKKDP